jgi:hypothetical protein
MNRLVWLWLCALLGLGALAYGWLVPAHLRAVDAAVLERAGQHTPTLVEQGLALVRQQQLGPAQLLLNAAQAERVPGCVTFAADTEKLAVDAPAVRFWGCREPLLDKLGPVSPSQPPEPVTDFVIRLESRGKILELLQASSSPLAQELLRFRNLTNTVLFPPSASSSGQALDATLCIAGLLAETGHFSAALSNTVLTVFAAANRGASPEPAEEILMDLLSLGQRFNWGQLAAFVSHTGDPRTLYLQTEFVRKARSGLPTLFSAVELSGEPAGVVNYLEHFTQTGLQDLGAALRTGQGGLGELLKRGQRLTSSSLRARLAAPTQLERLADFAWRTPETALTVKLCLYFLAGFFLAAALHFARPRAGALERPLLVRGFHLVRESLFALGFLLVVLLLSEPFLAQEGQKVEFPFRLRLPTVGRAVPVGNPGVSKFVMNPSDLLPLLLFFSLQGLLYISCLVKLAEIRRQRAPARLKLKLLENEDHLFDAGLYLGFLGTIVSFILYSVGVMKQFSLMVAYSSTSFGIVFVSLFKIVHLRGARRQLVLEAEAAATAEPAPRQTAYATNS